MEEFNLPEMFRVNYFSKFFFGEITRKTINKTHILCGYIQIFDGQIIVSATNKKTLITIAIEICHLKLTYGINIFDGKTIQILEKPYYLN